MGAVDEARVELDKHQSRLSETGELIRKKMRERGELLEKARSKKAKDPKNDERADLLDKEIKELFAEAQNIRERNTELRKRHHELADKVSDDEKRFEQAKERRKKRREQNRGGADEAVKWALAQEGKHESPSGSNWGDPVQGWILNAGYGGAVPWCGCFAHEVVVEHGSAEVSTQLGYAPNITADANANRNGLKAVSASEARAGDVGALWNGEHVVVLRGSVSGSSVPTIEGNTSAADGSQTNGGEVAAKTRSVSDFDVFARPAY